MAHRPVNYSAKFKRLRTLVLTVIVSISVPLVPFIADFIVNGESAYGGAGFFAQHPSILLMGVGLVTKSLYDELLKKQKKSHEKEALGKLCVCYIVFAILFFAHLQTFLPETAAEIYRTAAVTLITYELGVGLSVLSILAGRS